MCVRELDGGMLRDGARVERAAEERWAGVRMALEVVATRGRAAGVDAVSALGFGVMLLSAEGSLLFLCGAGVLSALSLGSGTEVSDMGGEGGS